MDEQGERNVGLCSSCRWLRRVKTVREQQFYLCQRSVADPAYPKYPALPVLTCRGWQRAEPA